MTTKKALQDRASGSDPFSPPTGENLTRDEAAWLVAMAGVFSFQDHLGVRIGLLAHLLFVRRHVDEDLAAEFQATVAEVGLDAALRDAIELCHALRRQI